ncbi:MAG: hypothetical protein JEZ00_15990 [Anaerolineaceae bacterium]|nr:hypothetical protein [Anaerolineaceae bacterium]
MKKMERMILFLVIAAICPILGMIGGWWIFYSQYPGASIPYTVALGGGLGILIDALFIKKWMAKAYQALLWIWVLIYLFYSVGIYGFFMGVPVPNMLLGIPAGILFASRLCAHQTPTDEVPEKARNCAWFTTLILLFACILSAVIALNDPYTAGNLEGMFALPFKITLGMIWGLIIIGGTVILLVQWWLTHTVVQRTYQWLDA